MATKKETRSMGPQVNMFRVARGYAEKMLNGAQIAGGLQEYEAGHPTPLDVTEFISFHKPTEILISRHYPGYRTFSLSGAGVDETLGLLLAKSVNTDSALNAFRNELSTPGTASTIITALLSRTGVTAKRGNYYISEKMILDVTAKTLGGDTDPNVTSAFAHVITKVLAHMDLVLMDSERKIYNYDEHYALTMKDIKRVVLTESLRDIFSEARISAAAQKLDKNASPAIIGEVISDMLRHASHSIPEIRLRMEQLDIVQSLVQYSYKTPEKLSHTMRASPTLATLGSYANFLAEAVANETPALTTASNSDMREACSAILTVLQSAPSIEAIPLSKYAEHFGFVPCSAPDGIYRGLVAYLALTQTSMLDVINIYPRSGASEIALIPTEYVPVTTMAGEITKTILSVEAVHGLANMVADEIAMANYSVEDTPILRTIGLTDTDVVYLAMSQAESVAIVKTTDETAPLRLIYATKVGEYWRTYLGASTPTITYFSEPQSLLVYQSGAKEQLPVAMAARNQTLEASAAYDTTYLGDMVSALVDDLAKPITFQVTMTNPAAKGESTELKLRISPLELLLGDEPDLDRGGSLYAIIREPGVDRDVKLMLALVAAYAGAGPRIIRDKAQSWLVETLTPLATHAAVTRTAVRALNAAVIKLGIDARKLEPQYKEAVVRSYFGTMFALLTRFGKLDGELIPVLLDNLPVNSLSVKTALALATMPTALDASHLNN